MSNVTLRELVKVYGRQVAVKGIDLEIESGSFVAFVGPSGCGKSTTLRMIAGLESVSHGDIRIGGKRVNDVRSRDRGIAMVFQSYALYPHMTVYENMAFSLKVAKVPREEIDRRVRHAADILRLTDYLDRRTTALSGGQRQRVAMGRAIIREPKVFLFDEPLSNLDAALRVQTRIEINKLHERMAGVTMIYVTHDQVEAMTLADRIVVLNAGRVEQVGAPMELYHHPDNLFVAKFLGSPSMNTIPCVIESGGANPTIRPNGCDAIRIQASIPESAAGAKGTFGVRPEDLQITTGDDAIFRGTIDIVEQLGEVTLIYVDIGTEEPIVAKLENDIPFTKGDQIALTSPLKHLQVFDEKGVAYRRT